jgi:hypothetical protein
MVTQFEKNRERRAEVNNLYVSVQKNQKTRFEKRKVEHTGDDQVVIERVSRNGLKPSKRRRNKGANHHHR